MKDWLAQGIAAHGNNEYSKAMECYFHALDGDFNNAEVLHYLGSLLWQMNYNGVAANILSLAIRNNPKNLESMVNLGACYFREWNFEGAEEIWTLALEQHERQPEPDKEAIAGTLLNLGGIGVHKGDYLWAMPWYERALAVQPGHDRILGNMSLAQLALGRWEEGWKNYDHHLSLNTRKRREYLNVPIWQGEEDKEVIVYGEQGIGDEIMFASMLPDLIKVSKRVIFDCHPRLVNAFKRSFGIECHGTRKTDQCTWFPGCGANSVVAIGSLGRFFRNTRESFPGLPYLKPRTARPPKHPKDKFKIGLSWKGGSKGTGDRFRSITLDELAPLIQAYPNVEWYSLQYHEDSSRYVLETEERLGVHLIHRPATLEGFDYDATIDLVNSLDLVISVPTSVVHVAGSIGTPCWVMVQREAAWRETGNVEGRGPSMPWYNSVKLFHRGENETTWGPLVNRIMVELSRKFGEAE